jgi:predicted outer membrane repeat protein
MKKLSISLLLFLIMILSVSVAFAADDDSSDLALTENVDDSTSIEVESVSEDVAQTSDNSVALQANIVEEKLEQTSGEVLADPVDSSKNFTELQKDIDTASYGFLTLDTNYVRAEGENDIVISKNFNIQGNDIYKIDANNLGGIFKINQGCAVTLMNVVLVNGNSNNGGTIYNEGTVNVISSQISNSTAVCGGAIYNKGVLIISGSTLDGNKATTLGGAVYSVNSTVVDGSNFINNEITTGSSYAPGTNSNGGAAIFSGEDSSLSVESSTFTQNTGDWAYNSFTSGGAIYAYDVDSISIKNNKFNENSAALGGAIMLEKYTQGTLAIINCEFNNNKGWQGGAINLNEFVTGISITGSNFTSNEATTPNAGDASPMGGAIVMGTQSTDGVSLSVDACNFNNNNGGYMGGAICSFANNDIKVTNSNFTGNEAEHYGGAITTGTGSSLTVDGCDFTNNAAPDFGAAILCEPNSQSKIVNSNFTGNVDNKGSAVTTIQGTLYLSKNKFNDAGIYNNGGVVTSNVTAVVLENGTLEVYDNTVTLTAIVTDDNGNAMRDNSFKFLINGKEVEATYSEVDGYYKGTYILPGAGIYTVGITSNKDENLTTKNGTVKNYKGTFTDLYGKVNDAISGGYDLDLEYNFTFVEGMDSDYIKIKGITIPASLNINGKGHTIDGASLSTGFTIFNGNVGFKNVTFTNLKTAIYSYAKTSSAITMNLNDCIFKDNQNSAIYAYDGELNAVDCIFVNNKGIFVDNEGTFGGAIDTLAYEDTVIDNCTFENNSADYGGAIYAMYSDVTITESRFINNNASYKGGAIYTTENTISISDSVLDGNDIINLETNIRQNWGGAAIYANETTVTLTNTNVTNNGRSNLDRTNGDMINAVVHLINSSATITGGLFENNTGIYGGAINAESGTTNTITVTGATFNNNKAYWCCY